MVRILGRAVVVVVVAMLATLASAVSPADAQVEVPPFESLRTGSTQYQQSFYNRVVWDVESGTWKKGVGSASNSAQNIIYRQTTKARIAARVLPAFGTFATRASLAGATAYAGWLIYQHFSGGSAEHDMWLDSAGLGANSLFNPCVSPPGGNCPPLMGWDAALSDPDSGQNSQTGLAFLAGYKYEVGAAWVYVSSAANDNAGCSTAQGGPAAPCFILHLNPFGYRAIADARNSGWLCDASGMYITDVFSACWLSYDDADAAGYPMPTQSQGGWSPSWPQQLWFAVERTKERILADVPGATEITTHTYTHNGFPVRRTKIAISVADLQTGTIWTGDKGTPTQTYNYNLPAPYYAGGPGTVGTTTDTQEALDEFDSPCGRAFINWVIEPGRYSFNPDSCGGWTIGTATFPLLAPNVNETYTAYLTRLQALGWLGSATTTEAVPGSEIPGMGPQGVTSVRIGANLYRPTAWPSPAPLWNVNVNVVVTYNPSTTPSAPGGGEPLPPGEGGVGAPPMPTGPLGDWCPNCPPVDFGPLTDADFGGSFPFGVVVWVGDMLGTLTTTADAPVFDFDYTETAAGSMGTYNLGHYAVDLEVLDSYMSIIRTILSWAIWIGGVWWFGSRLLGFRETGDPGAAVDEAW